MKIQLERTLTSCPERLRCVVCRQAFEVGRVRTLLYNDRKLLQGDVCSRCLKLEAKAIKLKIRQQAEHLLNQPARSLSQLSVQQDLALELLETAQEEIKFPTLVAWIAKKIEIFAQESQELEAARLGRSNCQCGKRSRIKITFRADEP